MTQDTDHQVIAVSNEERKPIMVSMFKNCKSTEPITVDLEKIYEAIVAGKYKMKVGMVRFYTKQGDIERADDMKVSSLPAFTISGVFNGRTQDSLVGYNQLVGLDFDYIPEDYYTQAFEIVKDLAFTYMAFMSPKGLGFKVVVRVNSDQHLHREAFNQVKQYFEDQLGINADPTSDINRLCILSDDVDAYYDKNCSAFLVEKVASAVKGKAKGVTTNFDLDLQYRFEKVLEFTKNSKQFFKGNRNNFVFLLAINCLRRGFLEDETLGLILRSEYSHDEPADTASIKGAYRNHYNDFNSYPLLKAFSVKDQVEKVVYVDDKVVASVADVAPVAQLKYATIKSFHELAKEGKLLKPKGKLLGNYILERSTTLFPSERGIGKSLLVMQLAICIARGDGEYLGEAIDLHGNVLYINLELDNDTVAARMKDLLGDQEWVSEYNADCFTSRKGIKFIYNDILEYCSKKTPVLIIIDNLRTAFSGSDNEKNSQMTEMITLINELKDQTNTAMTIVHHTKKGTSSQITHSDMQSGAGALTDLVDADFFLRRSYVDKDLRILKRVKARNCAEQEGAKLIALNPETLWFEFEAEGVDESDHVIYENAAKQRDENQKTIIQLINKGLGDAEIAEQVGCNRSTVFRQRKRLL